MQIERVQKSSVKNFYVATLSWTKGLFWWKKKYQRKACSDSGIVWEWETGTPGFVHPDTAIRLEAIVKRMKREQTLTWGSK